MRTRPLHLLSVAAAGLLLACGNGGLPGITPSVTIDSPKNNSAVNLSSNKEVAVNFSTNYTLKAPGTCGTVENCGHVYLLIDNTNCNQSNLPYNALAVASPVQADFSKCASPTGSHTITLELHRDDKTPVFSVLGNPITDTVTITTQ